MYCKHCGKQIEDGSSFCPYCGGKQNDTVEAQYYPNGNKPRPANSSVKSRGLALILCCVGYLFVSGIHRFYVNKIGTGVLWLLTGGLFGIGTIIDTIQIACGNFTDDEGKVLTDWNLD